MSGSALFRIAHNIPSPYRLHLFRSLGLELGKRGLDLHVDFYARGHTDRPEAWQNPDILFSHAFWTDFRIPFGRSAGHLNPGLIAALARSDCDYLMVGGIWDTPTSALLSLSARAKCRIGWLEGNTRTPGVVTGPLGVAKRALMARYDWLAVPGSEGRSYAGLVGGPAAAKKAVILPNLVDERRFKPQPEEYGHRREMRQRLGLSEPTNLALLPARLEPVKGIPQFLALLDPEILAGWVVLIVGEGSQQAEIERLIASRQLGDHVRLRPYVPYDDMPALYRAADLFVLPSAYDPNPLSVIEAMHSGLPLLLSMQCGNFPEALQEGLNGWGFDPFKPAGVMEATRAAFSADISELRAMGLASTNRAQQYWTSTAAVSAFCDALGIGQDLP